MAPGRVITCVARVSAEAATAGVLEAAQILRRGSLHGIAYASTSTAYAIGFDEEMAVVATLSQQVGLPVSSTCASAVLALRTLDVERVALVHPPWFDAELNQLGAGYFRGEGFDVVSCASAALSQDPARIEADGVFEWISRHVGDPAEAVFVGGNGFRAAGAIAALEGAIDRPVLTSNQVLLWNLLASARAGFEIDGYGRLFMQRPRSGTQRRTTQPARP